MNFKKIADRVLFALSVPKCVCCGEKLDYGVKALCQKCSAAFVDFKLRNCPHCGKILCECDCSNDFLKAHFIKRVTKSFRYLHRDEATPANSLIYSLKRDNRADVLDICADEMILSIRNSITITDDLIITNVPRRKSAIVEYGIDHSALLAETVAKKLSVKYISLFTSKAKVEQKNLDQTQRYKNAKFVVKRDIDLTGKTVIIVDDIITTGASMAMAASLLRTMGCKDIVASALAIAYRD